MTRNNLIGSWQMTNATVDHFMFEGGGRIIFVTAATRRGFAHTAATRGGVTALMKTLVAEWAEYGIQLNCVAPGTIWTDAVLPKDPPNYFGSNGLLVRLDLGSMSLQS